MSRSTLHPCLICLPAVFALSACTPPPKSGQDAEPSKQDAKAASEPEVDATVDATAGPAADAGKKDAPAKDCCRYCLDTVACGDDCLDEGKTCETESDGCACAGTERPAPKFREGDRALAGLIRADVPAFNKAQGDPVDGFFTLDKAFEGDEQLTDTEAGTLYAKFKTSMGDFECELFEEHAPLTVANFVGLARGVRPFKDPKSKEWTKRPFYDGVLFHRVIDGFMVQTGDPTGTGTGNPGYFIPDEFHPQLRHVGPGILSMANRNRVDPRTQKLRTDPKTGELVGNTGSSQFFITVTSTGQLDDRHSVFGKCSDASVPKKIAKVETVTNAALRMDHKPKEDVKIETIEVYRK